MYSDIQLLIKIKQGPSRAFQVPSVGDIVQKFITIDDKIISFDLNDLKIMSQPLVYSSCNLIPGAFTKFYYQDRMSEGRFVLKVTDLRMIAHWLPSSCLKVVDVIHIGGIPLFVVMGPDTYYPDHTFELSMYIGNQTDKSTWKSIQRLSRCRFDITVDREIYQEWLTSIPILSPGDNPPYTYQLSGIFEDYQDNSSANCEVI